MSANNLFVFSNFKGFAAKKLISAEITAAY
jgi:hypothetical protein